MPTSAPQYDLVVVGAGINGAGIARDAAGRGLKVLIVERDTVAAATSQWSTKLIHGGLRYLEQYEFRLVREALAEREIVLRQAPHIVEPLAFVLPHEPHLRPTWMLRAGLFLYDHLGRREKLPGSFGVDLRQTKWGAGLQPRLTDGFVYSDARVDDARLVVFNVIDACERGAELRVETRFVSARREQGDAGPLWRVSLALPSGAAPEVSAKAIVNASGPWVKDVRDAIGGSRSAEGVRHIKGSHIVVPRVHDEDHAYILQNADNRIVFVIPYHGRYSLIGTTDVSVESYEHPEIAADEVDYLLRLANSYLARPIARDDVVWSYSGVRPLYDDGASDPSAITRDYVFKLDVGEDGGAPALSIYGGKITTYRKLAEQALEHLAPFLPMKARWTETGVLPGGNLPAGGMVEWIAELTRRYPALPAETLGGIARRHGTRALRVLGDARTPADLGGDYGNGLTGLEIAYLVRHEWARNAADVLWCRTKCGIGMTSADQARVADDVAKCVARGSA